LKTALN